MESYSFAVLFIGLIFDILLLIFIAVSCLLIYSLLLISVETKAFETGVMRMVASAFASGTRQFAALQAAASASGPGGHDTLIQLDADDSILLEEVDLASLNADDVILV